MKAKTPENNFSLQDTFDPHFPMNFNGYDYWGSFDKCGKVANACRHAYQEREELPDSIIEIRTCLFFERRRWHHYGYSMDEDALQYENALLKRLRELIAKG